MKLAHRMGCAGAATFGRGAVPLALLVLVAGIALSHEVKFDAETRIDGEVVVALLSDKDPVISATIPDRGEGRFIVDTAAQITLLDKGFVERLGLPVCDYTAAVAVSRGDGAGRALLHYTRVERLMIGEAAALDLTPPVLDLSRIQADLAGIIGQDILRNWAVLFDAPRKQLRILGAGPVHREIGRLVAPGTVLHSYPVKWVDRLPRLTIAEEASPDRFDLVLDTGATGTSLPRIIIEKQKLKECGTTPEVHIAGCREEPTYRLGLLDLGRWRVSNLLVGATDMDFGLLGYNVLKEFVFVVDGPGAAVHMMYNPIWK